MLAALDVALGLVLMYLLLSLFATSIGEVYSQARQLRARNLEESVRRMLGGSQRLADKFYTDPRVLSLSGDDRKPSYLPAEIFADVLLDLVVGPGGVDQPAGKRGDAIANFGWGLVDSRDGEPAPADADVAAAASSSTSKKSDLPARQHVSRVLQRFSDDAGDDAAALRAAVARWFNAAMDRASGSFRRTMQLVLIVIGFCLATAADADTIRVARVLFDDPALRTTLADAAASGTAPAVDDLGPVVGWTAAELRRASSDLAIWTIAKLAGLLLTAVAVSLGGPFWFNALQTLLQIRGSIRPADRKPSADGVPDAAKQIEAARSAQPTAAAPATTIDPSNVFEPGATRYTSGNAWVFAKVAEAAYLDKQGFEASLPGTWTTATLTGDQTDTQVYLASSERAVIVAFRGTESLKDAHTDANLKLERRGDSEKLLATGKEHFGFQAALDSVWKELHASLTAAISGGERPVHFCGHSLGGALAVLAALRWATETPRRPIGGVYTYGQPRCGNEALAKHLETALGDRIYRHVNHRDAVPRLPPRSLGFRHAGRCLYFDARERLHDSPAMWFQVLDTVPLSASAMQSQVRETLSDHRAHEYVRLARAQVV